MILTIIILGILVYIGYRFYSDREKMLHIQVDAQGGMNSKYKHLVNFLTSGHTDSKVVKVTRDHIHIKTTAGIGKVDFFITESFDTVQIELIMQNATTGMHKKKWSFHHSYPQENMINEMVEFMKWQSTKLFERDAEVLDLDNQSLQDFKTSSVSLEGLFYNWDPVSVTINLLRFYSDGLVLQVPIGSKKIEDLTNVLRWFNRENPDPQFSSGIYNIEGNEISFDSKNKAGVVKYSGVILNDYELKFKVVSLINGYTSNNKMYEIVDSNSISP